MNGIALGQSVNQQNMFPNDTSTGTTINKLVKLSGQGAVVIDSTSDSVLSPIGVVTAGAGTSGTATVVQQGIVKCVFDGPTTALDLVSISNVTGGDCTDAGSSRPTSGDLGFVLSTNAGAGTYYILFRRGTRIPPQGNSPQIVGYSASNTPEAETISPDCTFSRSGTNAYTITCTEAGGGTGTFTAGKLITGTNPNITAGTAGMLGMTEGSAPTTLAGADMCWADQSAHRIMCNANGGSNFQIVLDDADINSADQVTSVAHITTGTLGIGNGGTNIATNAGTSGQVLSDTTSGVTSWVTMNGITLVSQATGAETTAARWAAVAPFAGHFFELVCTATLTGTCTTSAPEYNVFDITSSTSGTATTGLTTTVGTLVKVSETLAFSAGDTIAIGVSSAEVACTVPQFNCIATTTQP